MDLDGRSSASLLTTLHNLFSSTNPAVKKLMGWTQVDDEEEKWAERAVEALVKRLKKKRGALEDLERAVTNPNSPSKCVTINRSLDGRIQVSHRKGHPHVMYCRLWRWPDLLSHHELQPLDICQYPFSARYSEICINPYHYRRMERPKLPEVIVTKNSFNGRVPSAASAAAQQENSRAPISRNVTLCSVDNSYSKAQFSPETMAFLEPATEYMEFREPAAVIAEIADSIFKDKENMMYDLSMPNTTAVPYVESFHWASIAYYELNSRVGEIFNCSMSVINVDGFTDPAEDGGRFSLGKLTNVHRNSFIESTRRHIGRGIQLHYAAGQVYAECVSEQAIFVQSRNCNYEANLQPTTVIKIPPGATLKIFDNKLFSNILARTVHRGFEAVYELTKMCTVRISLVKGWGADYHRHEITATPCWIEVHLNGPLRWLDNVLNSMGAPHSAISSVS